jgi:hypothetical protein
MTIDKKEVEKLKASLSSSSEVLTPDSEGYAESIKRWSSAAEKPAVRTPTPTLCKVTCNSPEHSLNATRAWSYFQQPPKMFQKRSSSAKPTGSK